VPRSLIRTRFVVSSLAVVIGIVLAAPSVGASAIDHDQETDEQAEDLLAPDAFSNETASRIRYTTRFVNPGPLGQADLTVENYVIQQINATPAGEQISFAVRDWTRMTVATALTNAFNRGVDITGVIDGSEAGRAFLQVMVNRLTSRVPGSVIFCGTPTFEFLSCISNVLEPGLMHNKFWTFSRLNDGSTNVVIQTSQNWTAGQASDFQDMVRIDGDVELYSGYRKFVEDMKMQRRTDDYFRDGVRSGDNGRNTMYPFPRRQRDVWSDDTIVDRLDEIDCSEGGSASGTGLIRVAQFQFHRERMVVARKLIELHNDGCDVQVLNSHGHADVVADLIHAGVEYCPMFLGTIASTMHTKYWFVDAKSELTGARTKTVYAGSANWRADQHQTDDLLLRIIDDGVYDAYNRHWEGMRLRCAYTRGRPPELLSDPHAPYSALSVTPALNARPWNNSDVEIRLTASDGVGDYQGANATGMKRLHVEMSGAETGSWDFTGPPLTVSIARTLTVSAEGTTRVTFFGEDHKGNRTLGEPLDVRIDKTPPTITGLPADCELWPPNHRMVRIASVSASDSLSGLADLDVSASSSEADSGLAADDLLEDVVISGENVEVRAERDGGGSGRTYTVTATATDLAGNGVTSTSVCTVPHDSGPVRGR
jgi:hypothetical protein